MCVFVSSKVPPDVFTMNFMGRRSVIIHKKRGESNPRAKTDAAAAPAHRLEACLSLQIMTTQFHFPYGAMPAFRSPGLQTPVIAQMIFVIIGVPPGM